MPWRAFLVEFQLINQVFQFINQKFQLINQMYFIFDFEYVFACWDLYKAISLFYASGVFLYPLITLENL